MSTPNPFETSGNNDVENGTDNSDSNAGQFTIGDVEDVDDESTLQPPPSVMTSNYDGGEDEEAPVHDQLPTPEEYKAKMDQHSAGHSAAFAQFSPSKVAAELSEAGSVVGDVHDQLPTVDEYKSSKTFEGGKKSRAGLYTFLLLFLATAIITAVTVPLVLKEEEKQESQANQSGFVQGGGSSGSSGSSSTSGTGGSSTSSSGGSTSGPATNTNVNRSRYQKTIDYLVDIGISTREELEDPSSPQYQAADWIANVDEYQIALPVEVDNGSDLIPHTPFTERYALAVFYYATFGNSWKYGLKFMEAVDHCEWFMDFITTSGSMVRMGVAQCETPSGFEDNLVHKLVMPNNGLAGSIPKEISFLHRLTHLVLPFNADLVGSSSLDGLHALTYLSDLELQYCGLTGQIPEFMGNLRALTNVGFGNNLLSGPLPSSFFGLTNLELLGLDDNALTGPIGPFGALTNLKSLYLEDNRFSGELTSDLFSDGWTNIVELDLSVNILDGPLPSNLFSVTTMEVLDIHGNNFVGPIPEITVPHDNLFFLALHENKLDWRIPETINNLVNLAHLDISKNNMEIPFPSTFPEMTTLRYLFTGDNPFEDHPIPEWVASMTNLRELSMKANRLTGTIPAFIGGLTRLQVLDLDRNSLTGPIPDEIGLLTGVDTLMLNRNLLTGTIPDTFSLMNDLGKLSF